MEVVALLHCDLEAVEETCLRDLYFLRESFHKVLVHDAVGRGEEGQDVADEVPLVVVQLLPVVHVVRKIDLLRSPEACLGLLVLEKGQARNGQRTARAREA